MKSYLGLVSEYARVHKKKNRLTSVCIAASVMLVTAIFGMADMSVRAQIDEYIRSNGNFHAIVTDITDRTAEQIGSREEVKVSGWLGMAEDTVYQGKELIVQSGSKALAEAMNLAVTQGAFPADGQEALLDRQGLEQFGISIGGTVEIPFKGGQVRQYKITGTYGDFSSLKGTDAHGLFLSEEGMRALSDIEYKEYYYIQFKRGVNIDRALSGIKAEYGLSDSQVSPNVMLLGLMGQSDDTAMNQVYLTAGGLFLLVALAATLMIAGSFNMSVLERTQFFGLLRCLGATKKQIRRYIRLEGLRYCIRAVPAGLLAGCIVLWAAVFVLNELNSTYLPEMPMFQISWPGIAAGAVIGFLVVMAASDSPARHAARVSPQAAVTGNLSWPGSGGECGASNTKLFRVDTAMGIHHAFSNKKSMVLVAGSFAISIILFLCFSILITFMNHALNPLKPYAPDLSVQTVQGTALLDRALKEKLQELPHADKVYGRMFYTGASAYDGRRSSAAMLISYDEPQLEWAGDMLISGALDSVKDGSGVLVGYGHAEELGWRTGDMISLGINGKQYDVSVAGIIADMPFEAQDGSWIFLCSESAFTAMTGISDYTVIDMQVSQDISGQVRGLITPEVQLLDKQQKNSEIRTGYHAVAVFVYGFLLVIASVALINIINTVNASVSGRMGSYGVMMAVGMSPGQLKKVIRAEAAVYAVTGSITGAVLGVFLHRLFFGLLITSNWGQLWEPPAAVLLLTVSAALLTSLIAVASAAQKLEKTNITAMMSAG